MNKRNKKTIAPPRLAAIVTGFGLVACAAGSFGLYAMTVYTPILLAGLLLLLPVLANLLLLIPFQKPQAAESVAVIEVQDEDGGQVQKKKLRAVFERLKRLCRRGVVVVPRLWREYRACVLSFLIVSLAIGINIVFWTRFNASGMPLSIVSVDIKSP